MRERLVSRRTQSFYDYDTTLLLTTYRVCDTGFTSWLRGAFSRNDPERRSQEWRPTLRREPQRGRSGPRPPGVNAWRGQSLRLRSHCREPASWVRIRKPPRWSAERGPGRTGTGGRASQARPKSKSAPVGAPSTPHRGCGSPSSRRLKAAGSLARRSLAKAGDRRSLGEAGATRSKQNPGAARRRGNEEHCAV